MNIIKKLSLLTVLLSFVFVTSCSDDDDPAPTSGTLNITVNITNPDAWPTGQDANGDDLFTVYANMDANWPPQGPPSYFTALSNSQVQNGSMLITISDIAFGSYALVSVSLKDESDPNPATNQTVLATHSGSAMSGWMDATPVTFDVNSAEQDFTLQITFPSNN